MAGDIAGYPFYQHFTLPYVPPERPTCCKSFRFPNSGWRETKVNAISPFGWRKRSNVPAQWGHQAAKYGATFLSRALAGERLNIDQVVLASLWRVIRGFQWGLVTQDNDNSSICFVINISNCVARCDPKRVTANCELRIANWFDLFLGRAIWTAKNSTFIWCSNQFNLRY